MHDFGESHSALSGPTRRLTCVWALLCLGVGPYRFVGDRLRSCGQTGSRRTRLASVHCRPSESPREWRALYSLRDSPRFPFHNDTPQTGHDQLITHQIMKRRVHVRHAVAPPPQTARASKPPVPSKNTRTPHVSPTPRPTTCSASFECPS